MTKPIAVLGAGSWGTALAVALTRRDQPALLWGRDPDAVAAMRRDRCNARYLPDAPLPPALEVSADLGAVLEAAGDVLVAAPSHAFRAVLQAVAEHRPEPGRLAWATKGLDDRTARPLDAVATETLGPDWATAAVSGPSFAHEVARGLPTALTVASHAPAFARALAERLHDRELRVYTSDDLLGVQLGGALKNVLAIATGIGDGLGLGANSRAALVTRGLAELIRLGTAMGARQETLVGLSGLGDLVLTCTDDHSRNRRLGLALGRGQTLDAALRDIGQVVEGARTAREAVTLGRRHRVDLPISEQVYRILHEGCSPQDAVETLLARNRKPEAGAP